MPRRRRRDRPPVVIRIVRRSDWEGLRGGRRRSRVYRLWRWRSRMRRKRVRRWMRRWNCGGGRTGRRRSKVVLVDIAVDVEKRGRGAGGFRWRMGRGWSTSVEGGRPPSVPPPLPAPPSPPSPSAPLPRRGMPAVCGVRPWPEAAPPHRALAPPHPCSPSSVVAHVWRGVAVRSSGDQVFVNVSPGEWTAVLCALGAGPTTLAAAA